MGGQVSDQNIPTRVSPVILPRDVENVEGPPARESSYRPSRTCWDTHQRTTLAQHDSPKLHDGTEQHRVREYGYEG
jgi:hypothetical protein